MKGLLIDTNAYSAFKLGDDDIIKVFTQAPLLALNTVVLGELLGGFVLGNKEKKNREELNTFLALPQVVLFKISSNISEMYAQVYKQLRRAGTPVPVNDMWIAATALHYGFALCTLDGHFDHIEGLDIVRSSKDLARLLR